jgi:serine/threonine protein kinase
MGDSASRVFRVGACLGRGGFGEVYRATLRTEGGLETEVAIKVLRTEVSQGDALARFRDEGRVLSRFQHPCVVKAHDWARLEGNTVLVTEFVDGFDLSTVIGSIPLRPALEVVGAIASALDAAWSTPGPDGRPLRIVHRDLKPTNLRLGRHGQVKLLDFGIAVLGSGDRESHTRSALLVGSLPYMAPERFTERENTPAVDVYGLGCCLFEMLAGQAFHQDARLRELSALALQPGAAAEHLERRLATLPATVPPAVVALARACLQLDPAERPQAADVSTQALQLSQGAVGPTLRRYCADQPPTPPVSPGPWTGRTLAEGESAPVVADGSRAAVQSSPRETMHPDDPPRPAPPPAPPPLVAVPPVAPVAVVAPPSRAPWVLAGFGCLVVVALVGAGLAGFAVAAALVVSGG